MTGITGVLDFGVGNGVYPNVAFSVPAQCAHWVLLMDRHAHSRVHVV